MTEQQKEMPSGKRRAFWVLFSLCTAGLLAGIFTAESAGKRLKKQLEEQLTSLASLKESSDRLEELKAAAKDKSQLRSDEKLVIRSMLRAIRSIDDMEFDLDQFVWRTTESWHGEGGSFSVFFYVPRGSNQHRLVAEARPVDKVIGAGQPPKRSSTTPLPPGGFDMDTEPVRLDLELESDSKYEFRVTRDSADGESLRLRLEVLDESGAVLTKGETQVNREYTYAYSHSAGGPTFALPNVVSSHELARAGYGKKLDEDRSIELLRISLPFKSVKEQSLRIRCEIKSDGNLIADPLDLVNHGMIQPEVIEALTRNSENMLDVGEIVPKE